MRIFLLNFQNNQNKKNEQKKLRKEIMQFYKLKEKINKELSYQREELKPSLFRKTLILEEKGEKLYKKLKEKDIDLSEGQNSQRILNIEKGLSLYLYLTTIATIVFTIVNKMKAACISFICSAVGFGLLLFFENKRQKIKDEQEILEKTKKQILEYYKYLN